MRFMLNLLLAGFSVPAMAAVPLSIDGSLSNSAHANTQISDGALNVSDTDDDSDFVWGPGTGSASSYVRVDKYLANKDVRGYASGRNTLRVSSSSSTYVSSYSRGESRRINLGNAGFSDYSTWTFGSGSFEVDSPFVEPAQLRVVISANGQQEAELDDCYALGSIDGLWAEAIGDPNANGGVGAYVASINGVVVDMDEDSVYVSQNVDWWPGGIWGAGYSMYGTSESGASTNVDSGDHSTRLYAKVSVTVIP